MDATISVIIPIYKVEEYLVQCIQSVVKQTYRNLEIILVDDGSPDKCPQICDEFANVDKRIRVVHKQNGGLSEARNTGLAMATGEYLLFVDGDDFIQEDLAEKMLDKLIENNAEIAACGRYIYDNGIISKNFIAHEIRVLTSEEALVELFRGRALEEATWDKLYKKSLFEGIAFPSGEINEDLVTIPYVLERCNHIVHIGEPKYYYRVNTTGISKSPYNEKKTIVLSHLKQIRRDFAAKSKNLAEAVDMLEARYAYSALMALEKEDTVKKAHFDDYTVYKELFSNLWLKLFHDENMSVKSKIQIVFLRLGIYGPARKMVHWIKNLTRNGIV